MVAGGIRAIWNFAPIRLHTPEHVIVHNEDLYCSLAALSQKLFRGPAKPAATTAPEIQDRQRRDPLLNQPLNHSCAHNQRQMATAESL